MKSVLVTGGTGSFGKAFVARLLKDGRADRICVYSRGEHAQEALERELAPRDPDGRLRFFLGDLRDRDRLEMAMRDIDVVVHAGALKIAPKGESDPLEFVKTNIMGTQNVIEAALRLTRQDLLHGRMKLIMLSSDKAAASHTLYGATKFCAERLFVAANNLSGANGPQFAAVRAGNVVGSRGSVVPLFKALVANGATELPITDPRMTRFEITIDAVVEFVWTSLHMMKGGEVFIPKIPARRIVDVAREIAPDLPHKIVGIRPAEKLHEVLITEEEARQTLELQDRYVIQPFMPGWTSEHLLGAKPVADGFSLSSDIASRAVRLEAAE